MHIPNELVVAILESVGSQDLKSARLVCKTWCSYASGFLFDKIYVAPNRVDLEVFNAITQDPILSKCVRQLVYEGSEFVSDLTKRSYVEGLWSQTALMFDASKRSLHGPDPQTNDWIYDVSRCRFSMKEGVSKWKDHSLIKDGYKEYQAHSIYQQRTLQSGAFVESLVQGLSRLVCLESVTLEGGWPLAVRKSLYKHRHGTPLARRWNPFHCCPQRWYWEPEGNDSGKLVDGMRHYWIITAALVRAQRHINDFAIGRDYQPYETEISPEIFERKDPMRPNALGLDIAAFSGLERLHLRFATCADRSVPEYWDNIEGLLRLLGSMHSLRRLDLYFPYLPEDEDYLSLYRYDQVFPQEMAWNNLVELALYNFASSATDLLRLFLIQMPNLKRIRLGVTQLLEGCWESVIECLKQYNQFTSFEVDDDYALCHYGTESLDCRNIKISEYVVHGGRHPCLLVGQLSSEAYMLKIDASLRDRLLEMKRSRTHVAI